MSIFGKAAAAVAGGPVGLLASGIWDFLKAVPWQVYAAGVAGVAFWWWGSHQHAAGVHQERSRWEALAAADTVARAERDSKASAHRAAGRDKIAATAATADQRAKDHYDANPSERAAVCLDAERVSEVNAALCEIAGAAGGGCVSNPDADPTPTGDPADEAWR